MTIPATTRSAQAILDARSKRWPRVKHLFADGAYDRLKLMNKAAWLDFTVQIIRRSDQAKGFEVLPRRWVAERSLGWMIRWRRLVRNDEARINVSKAIMLVAMCGHRSTLKSLVRACGTRHRMKPMQ